MALASLAATALLLAAAVPAFALPAPSLFMTTGGTGESSKTALPSELWRVDPNSGQATSVGNTGYAITGLAQDPTTGILYAISNNKSPLAPRTLLAINPANGAAAAVGPLGEIVADITFDSQGRLFGWSEETDDLASIDKVTGDATVVGDSALSTYGSASAFDINDTYWLFGDGEGDTTPPPTTGEYWTLDTTTGKPTSRGFLTPLDENESSISAAAFDCARTTVYGTFNNCGKPPAYLLTIDTATGVLTNKGLTVTGADGLEWYCPLAFEFGTGPIKVASKRQTLSVPIIRGPRVKGAASVNVGTVDGSAKAGQDFVGVAGPLAFANNVANATLSLPIKANPKAGKNRTFEVALSGPSGGGSVGASLQVTILAAKPKPAKVKGPKKTSAERVEFKLRSAQLPARFRCKLDKGKFKGCGKNSKKGKKFTTPKLEPGKHKLVVQVVNGAGKKSKPVKKTFTVLP
ncbi:MAG TPA: Calx-beta domain-containing protein [Solirubrobacterales bacterium]|nr:Calx-beta domain-containing protein [Solirubrobacterales bacterium]